MPVENLSYAVYGFVHPTFKKLQQVIIEFHDQFLKAVPPPFRKSLEGVEKQLKEAERAFQSSSKALQFQSARVESLGKAVDTVAERIRPFQYRLNSVDREIRRHNVALREAVLRHRKLASTGKLSESMHHKLAQIVKRERGELDKLNLQKQKLQLRIAELDPRLRGFQTQLGNAREEEKRLKENFPSEWEEYSGKVPRLVPSFSSFKEATEITVSAKEFRKGVFDLMYFVVIIGGFEIIEVLHEAGYLPVFYLIY